MTDNYYADSLELLKYVAETYGLNIEIDKPFEIDGYWAHYPCKMNKSKWPVGMHNLGPRNIRVDYRGPEIGFVLNGSAIYVHIDRIARPRPLVPPYI